ncbi:hypothetical protein ABZ070_37220, partial [Streptomyces sp. NPDC006283]|uniref:hypothetical protein n=1 Tax=Streptomyces sp. NPDC006283 TaxID=3156741 RepID=UPI0033A2EE4A
SRSPAAVALRAAPGTTGGGTSGGSDTSGTSGGSDTSGTIKYPFNLDGSSKVKAANGSAKLNGGIDVDFDLNSGTYEGDLTLNPTEGNFNILGILKANAKITYTPVGRTTGSLEDGKLVSNSNMIVKLPQISIFGLPIGGGDKCQTAKPSAITLTSTGPSFDPLKGGEIVGEYELAPLQGCGIFNDIISRYTAGPGNIISATLTPKKS